MGFWKRAALGLVLVSTACDLVHSYTSLCTTSSRTAVPRAGIRLAAPQFHFEQKGDVISFGAAQSFVVPVRPQARTAHEYVSHSPKRLILASWNSALVRETSDPEVIALKFMPLDFLLLKIEPEVDCQIVGKEGAAGFFSTGFRIDGLEEHVSLDNYKINIKGEVQATPPGASMMAFRGRTEFRVSGTVPPILQNAPEAASRAAAHQLSQALLSAAESRFQSHLPKDYTRWANGD